MSRAFSLSRPAKARFFEQEDELDIQLTLEQNGSRQTLNFNYSRMVNAGYVGRDQQEVRRHIEELAQKGIPGPTSTPTLYPVVGKTLTSDEQIEVYGRETSGEVEYVLLVASDREIYVGLGSDHTDRQLEETDIPRAKQICPNIISREVWSLADVEAHWDEIVMRSRVTRNGEEVDYQGGRLELLLNPQGLLDFVRSQMPGPLDGTVIFSGTLGSLTGDFVYGERFAAELRDPVLERRLTMDYEVRPLDELGKG